MVNEELSEAICLYLGWQTSSWPDFRPEAVKAKFGPLAKDLIAQAESIVDELGGIAIDWSHTSLLGAMDVVRQDLSTAHPELTADAIEAAVWLFSFTNR